MLDLKNPINITLLVVAGMFALSMGALYAMQPTWLQKLNLKGKPEISYPLLVSYSLTFALLCGVVAMLLVSGKSVPADASQKPPVSSVPSMEMVNAYSDKET